MKIPTTLPVVASLLGVCLWTFANPADVRQDRYAPAALLTYRSADGAAAPVTSPADWSKRREQILAAMQQVMGPLPDRTKLPPLDVTVTAEEQHDGFVRQTISYVSEVDPKTGRPDRVPAYLYLPTNLKPGERRPAVLALHPTSKLGKAEIGGAGKPNREYGLELAKRGHVVLCPDYPSFGDLANFDFKASPHPSGTMKAVVNHLRGVDLLAARPEADAGRIAAIGHSLGGHNALFAAAFDERIKAVVTSCGWNVFEDYYKGNLTGWTSDRYMPRIKSEYGLSPARVPFDFHEVLAAVAPRAVLSISPTNDANFAVEGVRKGVTAAKAVYGLLGAPDALQVEHPDCGHDFPPSMRERAYAFMDAALKGGVAAQGGPTTAAPRANDAPATKPAAGAEDLAAELPRIPARSAEEAAKLIRTLPGFKAPLVAAEPLVFSPVAIDFDEDGRAFVCEMIDYPFPSAEPLGKIAVLEDTNGDGVFDRRTELADRLHWPTAVLCYDGGAFVASAPDIFYLKDTDGDGRADVRKVVFTGFGKQNVQGLINSFRWGIDNRVHGATGTNGGKVRRADLPQNDPATGPANAPVNLSGRDFSFDPRRLDLRPESGGAQHGMSFDDFGRKFVSSNSDHIQQVVYDDRYANLNPHVQLPPARVSIAADGPQAAVFRISPVEPWRVVRTRMRASGEVKGIVEGGGRPAGYFTGATGVTIYRGDAFPAEYRGQAFIGDVGSNLVHRKVLKPTDGVLLRAERVDDGKEFLASEDIWFRPAQFANAPDGTLYVLDVCREVIEHPASIPESVKQHLDLTNGRDRGRIYRVVPDGYTQRPPPKLSKATTAELVKLLEHRNGWHRDAASRLLYERQDKSAADALRRLAVDSGIPEAKVHALSALASLKELSGDTLRVALQKGPLSIGVHLIRLAELSGDKAVLRQALPIAVLTGPPHDVYLQLALSLGAVTGLTPEESEVCDRVAVRLLQAWERDPYIRAAALNAWSGKLGTLTAQLTANLKERRTAERKAILRTVARTAAQRGDPDDVGEIVGVVERLMAQPADKDVAVELVAGLAEGMGKGGPKERGPMVRGRVAELLASLLADSKRVVADASRTPADRAGAVRTLGLGSLADVRETLANLLGGKEPQEVQLAAVAALDAFADPAVGDVLTKAWPRLTPRVRAAAVDVVLARPQRAVAFLTAIQEERIPATDLDATRLARLRQGKDAAVRKLADAVAERVKLSPRADVVAAYRKSLELKGDLAKGRALFAQNCATCHRLENAGTEIGPNLAAMQSRGAEAVLVNVLDPNREVNGLFVEYVVETTDGRSLSGLLSGESAASVTLLKPGGLTETVARNDIEKLRSTGLSLMPEGLEKQLDPQAMADLVAYVMGAK